MIISSSQKIDENIHSKLILFKVNIVLIFIFVSTEADWSLF
jgi:hypothetical protein